MPDTSVFTDPLAFRLAVRQGAYRGHTAGQCPGFAQGNLAVLPADYADEFLRFCRRNPKACPVLGMSEPGDFRIPELGDVDIRRDIPGYRMFVDGEPAGALQTLDEVWRDDLVAFVLGCSLSFEAALIEAGIRMRHIEQGSPVPMYVTDIANGRAGRFGGNMVVSMRPMTPAQAIRAIQVTSRFPQVHGAPVHFGDPAAIGISDLSTPQYGRAVPIEAGEVPVFWACGVTPQQAIRSARPPLAFVHEPGHMLVCDPRNSDLAVF